MILCSTGRDFSVEAFLAGQSENYQHISPTRLSARCYAGHGDRVNDYP